MKYHTKPFEIEAIQFTGNNVAKIKEEFPELKGRMGDGNFIEIYDYLQNTWVPVNLNDYIIKGMKNEYYPCDPEVFEAKYVINLLPKRIVKDNPQA